MEKRTLTEEHRQRISESLKGRKLKKITRIRMSRAKRKMTEETRRKMSAAKQGSRHPLYGLRGKNHPNFGKKYRVKSKEVGTDAKNS